MNGFLWCLFGIFMGNKMSRSNSNRDEDKILKIDHVPCNFINSKEDYSDEDDSDCEHEEEQKELTLINDYLKKNTGKIKNFKIKNLVYVICEVFKKIGKYYKSHMIKFLYFIESLYFKNYKKRIFNIKYIATCGISSGGFILQFEKAWYLLYIKKEGKFGFIMGEKYNEFFENYIEKIAKKKLDRINKIIDFVCSWYEGFHRNDLYKMKYLEEAIENDYGVLHTLRNEEINIKKYAKHVLFENIEGFS